MNNSHGKQKKTQKRNEMKQKTSSFFSVRYKNLFFSFSAFFLLFFFKKKNLFFQRNFQLYTMFSLWYFLSLSIFSAFLQLILFCYFNWICVWYQFNDLKTLFRFFLLYLIWIYRCIIEERKLKHCCSVWKWIFFVFMHVTNTRAILANARFTWYTHTYYTMLYMYMRICVPIALLASKQAPIYIYDVWISVCMFVCKNKIL